MVVLALIANAGCSEPEGNLGTWRDLSGMIYYFRPDHTFTCSQGGGSATGTWTKDDKKVSLTIQAIDGKPADEVLLKMATKVIDSDPSLHSQDEKDKAIKAKVQSKKYLVFIMDGSGKQMKSVAVGDDAKILNHTDL